MGQRFVFGFTDTLLAEVGGVPLDALHFDVDAMLRAADSVIPIAEQLGATPPIPHIAGFGYPHVVALGAQATFPPDSEPAIAPIIHSIEDIDNLREPDDYLAAPLIQTRLALSTELTARRPDAYNGIGHALEGPVTTAVLLMGSDFLMLPYDDPKRAHKLLDFCTTSAMNYGRIITERLGGKLGPGQFTFPDDFAGMFAPDMFREFVSPYWDRLYTEYRETTRRGVHSELLRIEHLPILEELGIGFFDPGADHFLNPWLLRKHCHCPFQTRIQAWELRDLSPDELEALYRRTCEASPELIVFTLDRLANLPKIERLLKVAWELAGEGEGRA